MAWWSCFLACLPCFPDLNYPGVTIDGRFYKIQRLLGEGGFSYVYLVTNGQDEQYALKKIRCPYGLNDDSYTLAMREIRNYHRFATTGTPYVIQLILVLVVDENDGLKTIYVLLPYFERSLQDIINSNVLNHRQLDEPEIIRIFTGICRGVKVLHTYKRYSQPNGNSSTADNEDDALLPIGGDDDDEAIPLAQAPSADTELGELCPYAHRDLKPANIMLGVEGIPVLVDLGLCGKARITISNRQQALSLTDFALEHCTLPYRAPELLDVPTSCTITESTDIWSLGCVLYCCCFGYSPFGKLELEQGANLNIAIAQGKYTIPENNPFSPKLMDMITKCLQMDPQKRPLISELLEMCLASSP